LDDAERTQLVRTFATARPSAAPSFLEQFQQQAQCTPHHAACVFERRSLTYQELDQRANQLAWSLISAGAGPEGLIAIQLPRSLDMIIAVLGVLKSGAAYLPIEPDDPASRTSQLTGF